MQRNKMPFLPNNEFKQINPIIVSYLTLDETNKYLTDHKMYPSRYQDDMSKELLGTRNKYNLNQSAVETYKTAMILLKEKPAELTELDESATELQYQEFCKKHFMIFYRMIDKFLDHPRLFDNDFDFAERCIQHCCVTKHHATWELLKKAIVEGSLTLVKAFFTHYGDMSELYNTALLKENLLGVLLSPPLYREHRQMAEWILLTQKMLEISGDDSFILDRIKEKEKAIAKTYQEALEYKGHTFIYNSKLKKVINLKTEKFLLILAYEKKNKIKHNLLFDPEDRGLIQENIDRYMDKSDLDQLLKIYDMHVDATYFKNPTRCCSFFSKQYSEQKIKFIEDIQNKIMALLSEKNTTKISSLEIYDICKKLASHPLFSQTHKHYGVDPICRDKLLKYTTSIESICSIRR